jgi:methionyl-tRNA synthetase
MKKLFITTAIPYVNSPPHIGFALEVVQADAIARYFRILGRDVLFLTGTDENSLKNVQAAEKEGISTKELVDKNAKKFYQLKEILNLSFDDFIRTTQKRHIKGAQKLWLACKKDIYKKIYRGLYCVGCEEYYKEEELIDGLCPEHKTKPELLEEENYFFKLSNYSDKLLKIIQKDEIKIIPETRKNEILSFIKSGLEDICISRSTERARGWGIDVPGDSSQKIWVWFDALSNYINAVGYATNRKKFEKWWPADIHVIGKGISRFHCVYWPAILLSAKLPLPKTIFIHGYITVSGQKMSKSLGNVVSPSDVVEKYGADALRYFLLRDISPTEDGDFTFEKFERRYEGDLVKGLGNLITRIFGLIKNTNYFYGKFLLYKECEDCWKKLKKEMEKFQFNRALESVFSFVKKIDEFIEIKKPWQQKSKDVEFTLLNSLSQICWLIYPFLPKTSAKIAKALKIKEVLKKKPVYKKMTFIKGRLKIGEIETPFPKLKK